MNRRLSTLVLALFTNAIAFAAQAAEVRNIVIVYGALADGAGWRQATEIPRITNDPHLPHIHRIRAIAHRKAVTGAAARVHTACDKGRPPLDNVTTPNGTLIASMRALHDTCAERSDVATTSLLENWIDEGERLVWFLFEILRGTNA